MKDYATGRRLATWSMVVFASAMPRAAGAADPQPYSVELIETGDKSLDGAVRDSSTLVSLKDKAPVGGFALVRRAEVDAVRFLEGLHSFGYYDGKVGITIDGTDVAHPSLPGVIDAAPKEPPIPVVVTLDLGHRYHFGQINVAGRLPPAVTSELSRLPLLSQGRDALAAEVLAAQDRLLAAIREAGYPLAVVTLPPAVLHRDTAQLDVEFLVDTGPPANIGAIHFNGLRDVSEEFLRRHLLLRPGQPFSPSSIDTAQRDLIALGVFSSVRILPASHLDPDARLPVDVTVTERPPHAVDLGAAYSTDLGVNLNASWRHRNLFGEAEQLILSGLIQYGGNETAKPGYQLSAQYIEPDFLVRDQKLDVGLTALQQTLQAYDQIALIAQAGLERKLSPHWSARAGVLTEAETIVQNGTRREYEFAGLPLSFRYDSTTSLFDPVSGGRAAISFMPVALFGKPGGTYFVAQSSGSIYFDFQTEGRSVLAMRGLVGMASGVGVFGMPPDQRFYAGGNGTVRGYRYQSIGPRFPDRQPTGGTAVSAASIELRQRFMENYGVAAFLDAGQVSADGNPFSKKWQAGAGVGLRYYTSIGPIRLDVAVPLSRQAGDDSFELYIGLGQAF